MIVASWAEQTHIVPSAATHKAALGGRHKTLCGMAPRRVAGAATYDPDARVTCARCKAKDPLPVRRGDFVNVGLIGACKVKSIRPASAWTGWVVEYKEPLGGGEFEQNYPAGLPPRPIRNANLHPEAVGR